MPKHEPTSQRDALLGSGMPLEEQVARALSDIGVFDKGNLSFRRAGSDSDEEADRWGFSRKEGVIQRLVIECKYTRGKWIFYRAPDSLAKQPRYLLSQFSERPLTDAISIQFGPRVLPGVALYKDSNPANWKADRVKIPNAVRQVTLASAQLFAKDVLMNLLSTRNEVRIIHPIIVTTAEMCEVRNTASLADLEQAPEDLSGCLIPLTIVEVAFSPAPYMQQVYRDALREVCSRVHWHYQLERRASSLGRKVRQLGVDLNNTPYSQFGEAITAALMDAHLQDVPGQCWIMSHGEFAKHADGLLRATGRAIAEGSKTHPDIRIGA